MRTNPRFFTIFATLLSLLAFVMCVAAEASTSHHGIHQTICADSSVGGTADFGTQAHDADLVLAVKIKDVPGQAELEPIRRAQYDANAAELRMASNRLYITKRSFLI